MVLITDREADKAVVSMNVGMGSLREPSDVDGLAHFVEVSFTIIGGPLCVASSVYGDREIS